MLELCRHKRLKSEIIFTQIHVYFQQNKLSLPSLTIKLKLKIYYPKF